MYTYSITPQRFYIRDKSPLSTTLDSLFQDSHTLFKMRVQHLGNKKLITTEEESETLRIMLEALITAKQHLQKNNNANA